MKNKNAFRLLSTMLFLSLLGTGEAYAAKAPETITKEKVIESEKQTVEEDLFDEFVKHEGKKYKLQGVELEVEDKEGEKLPPPQNDTYIYETPVIADGVEAETPEETVEKDGKVYVLKDVEELPGILEERSTHAEVTKDFSVEYINDVPKTLKTEVTDELSGEVYTHKLPMTSSEVVSEEWRTGFTFPITVSDYDAEELYLGDLVIPADANLIDYADEFLKMLNLPGRYYRIDNITWNGEPYERDGIVCRDATADGRKLATNVTATYAAEVTLPPVEGTYLRCTYEWQEEAAPEEPDLYKITATATYDRYTFLDAMADFFRFLLDWIKTHPAETIGIVVLLILLFVILFLFLLSRKKKDDEEENDENVIVVKKHSRRRRKK